MVPPYEYAYKTKRVRSFVFKQLFRLIKFGRRAGMMVFPL